jgi:hypothetical protein
MCVDMQIQDYTRYTRRARLVEGRIQILVSWFTGFLYFVLYFTPLILTT